MMQSRPKIAAVDLFWVVSMAICAVLLGVKILLGLLLIIIEVSS